MYVFLLGRALQLYTTCISLFLNYARNSTPIVSRDFHRAVWSFICCRSDVCVHVQAHTPCISMRFAQVLLVNINHESAFIQVRPIIIIFFPSRASRAESANLSVSKTGCGPQTTYDSTSTYYSCFYFTCVSFNLLFCMVCRLFVCVNLSVCRYV